MKPIRIFISSVQKELAAERAAIRDFVRGHRLLRKFFEVFLFEEAPAADLRTDSVYLVEVANAEIYLGIFGSEYGWPGPQGQSPTHQEFTEATRLAKTRLIFVKGSADDLREPGMLGLIREAGDQLIRRRFNSDAELISAVDDALVRYLEDKQLIRNGPFDSAPCLKATVDDLSPAKLENFLRIARKERDFPRGVSSNPDELLSHLNLLDNGVPTHAAVLLFGDDPQRFLISSVVKCAHFHSTVVAKPIPSFHTFGGTVFDMIDQAVDFVMSKLARRVGTRKEGTAVPVDYEIPREVVEEAVVNAVAHRDYTSHGSVQVMLFQDRLEIWNPGSLPPTLTLTALRGPHGSVPANPHLAEPLYLAHYIERMGTGIRDMIQRCRDVGLREPEFELTDGFVVRIFRKTGQVGELNGQVGRQVAGQVALEDGQVTGQVTGQVEPWMIVVLQFCQTGPKKSREIQEIAGIKHRESFQRNYLDVLINRGWLERTVEKLTSRLQKYRLTASGQALLNNHTPPAPDA